MSLPLLRWSHLLLLILLAAAGPARTEDLGGGLTYFRPGATDALPAAPREPTVLDFRYLADDAPAAELAALLQSKGPLRIVLHGPHPPPGLTTALAGRAANVLTLAPAGANPPADFELAVEPAEDRAAYGAYEQNIPIDVLTRTGANKTRHDEAALVRGAPAPVEEAAAPADETAKAPVDRLLQRALQLARGLQALNRAR